jgi:hypothetical protein
MNVDSPGTALVATARGRSAAHLLTRDEARRIAVTIVKLPEVLCPSGPSLDHLVSSHQ